MTPGAGEPAGTGDHGRPPARAPHPPHHGTEGVGADHIRSFRDQHPGLDLDVQDIPPGGVAQHIEKLYAAAVGGEIADPYPASRNAIPELAVNGTALALDDLVRQSATLRRDDLWPSHLADASWKGRLYGVTHSTGVWALFLNERLWREAGLDPSKPPVRWDELRAAAQKPFRAPGGRIERLGYHPIRKNGGPVT